MWNILSSDIYSDQNYECWVASFDKNCDIKTDAIIGGMSMQVVLPLLEDLKIMNCTLKLTKQSTRTMVF